VEVLLLILLLAAIALLWVSAVVSGRDSRDGRDWRAGASLTDRLPRVGD
jgi:hypothetical protein